MKICEVCESEQLASCDCGNNYCELCDGTECFKCYLNGEESVASPDMRDIRQSEAEREATLNDRYTLAVRNANS